MKEVDIMAEHETDPSVKALVQSLKTDAWVNNLFVPKHMFYVNEISNLEWLLFPKCFVGSNNKPWENQNYKNHASKSEDGTKTIYHVSCIRMIQYVGEYVTIRNIRIEKKDYLDDPFAMYHLLEQKVIDRESVLFCNKDGSKICSDLTRDQYEQIIKTMCFFAKPCTWFTPLNRPDANLIAKYRMIGVMDTNEVIIYDFFKQYPLDEYQGIIDTKALKAFVVYDAKGHLCRACMNEESSQIIQKYIEDHEF
ncbi:hypothetical protein KC711_04500 [Candidatus Peregrinibacteria bacterium]|nr:hypothetical protein [Candidatus Peregrinibacteria bacterium]